jgi:hypothetical protein
MDIELSGGSQQFYHGMMRDQKRIFTVTSCNCSRTPLIRINLDGEPSEYAENPDNWIFL